MKLIHNINRNLNYLIHTTKRHKLDLIISQKRGLCSYSYIGKLKEDDSILPVLIVGAGPVGLVLSLLLTKFGIKHLFNPFSFVGFFFSLLLAFFYYDNNALLGISYFSASVGPYCDVIVVV